MPEIPGKWDIETDVLVIGSGAAGCTAAIMAHDNGANVTLIERSAKVGGTSSISGGCLWIPNSHHMIEKGVKDSREEALIYCKRIAGGKAPDELIETYIDTGPEMIKYIEDHTPLKVECALIPDYHPDFEGGHDWDASRSLGPLLYDKTELGEYLPILRPCPTLQMPASFIEMAEWQSVTKPQQVPFDVIAERLEKGITGFGEALMAPLFRACLDREIVPMVNTRALELVIENDRIIGIHAQQEGKDLYIKADKATILASGGFEWNEELKKAHLHGVITHPNSPSFCNEGDALKMAMSAGAELGNMSEHWGWISMMIPGEEVDGHPLIRGSLSERALPHCIIVNQRGKRFVNEAASYNDIYKAFLHIDANTCELENLPSWHIFDEQFHEKYAMMTLMPGEHMPDFVTRADTIEALASKMGIDPKGLAQEIERFNSFAEKGVDDDFQRGVSSYDHAWGDPENQPNPSLGKILKPPFYALENYMGSLGTKGGPKTNIKGQVLHVSGNPIPGLYAAGNAMASVAGASYFGSGGTLGPAMVFGYLCGINAAKE